jgi:hypothetical protein
MAVIFLASTIAGNVQFERAAVTQVTLVGTDAQW